MSVLSVALRCSTEASSPVNVNSFPLTAFRVCPALSSLRTGRFVGTFSIHLVSIENEPGGTQSALFWERRPAMLLSRL